MVIGNLEITDIMEIVGLITIQKNISVSVRHVSMRFGLGVAGVYALEYTSK
ncbi:hypothetical protein NHP200010_16290 [Helicobacter bizzozeronii]|nr:hypothetical protein NHP200010_16290 [Helicobacter bizzozeronii]